MAFTTSITLAASASRATSGTGTAVDCAARRAANVVVSVSAVTGTLPTLVCVIETSDDNVSWSTAYRFTSVNATGLYRRIIAGLKRYVRASWVIAGTLPSFTFSVLADSILVYADPADLSGHGVPEDAIASVDDEDQAKALIAATDELDGYFNDRYTLPLTAWGYDLRKRTAHVAAAALMLTRGLAPDGDDYKTMTDLRDGAYDWAGDVGAKKISPPGIVDSTPTVDEGGPILYTSAKRGW